MIISIIILSLIVIIIITAIMTTMHAAGSSVRRLAFSSARLGRPVRSTYAQSPCYYYIYICIYIYIYREREREIHKKQYIYIYILRLLDSNFPGNPLWA